MAAGGLLFAVAIVLHPSQETPVTILDTEARLVGSHAVYVVSYVLILLGLPGALWRRMATSGAVGVGRLLGDFRRHRFACGF